jgi:hypothetical protein
MKRSTLVAFGGLLLLGIVPVSGHAQSTGIAGGQHFPFCVPPGDIHEDIQEITASAIALSRAIATRQPQSDIDAARQEFRQNIADFRGDTRCQITSEDE